MSIVVAGELATAIGDFVTMSVRWPNLELADS
jgi:hypothetical protein